MKWGEFTRDEFHREILRALSRTGARNYNYTQYLTKISMALQNAIGIEISRLVTKAHGKSIEGCTQKLRPSLGLFNIYGGIVFKQKKRMLIIL